MLDGIHKIHLVGIAGAGMRAIANILISYGFAVSGSDIKESPITEQFRRRGAKIYIGHDGAYVRGVDAVVRSTAIHQDNPEIQAAVAQGIPILHRSDIVKAVLDMTHGIAVAGAHGKTTTTSMLGQIFVEAGLDPTIIIGGEVDYLKGNSCLGRGEYSIAEADESDGSFVKLNPKSIVITNVENDHMDHYGTMENLLQAFAAFLEKLPSDGKAIVCGDNQNIRYLMGKVERQFVTYGLAPENDYYASAIEHRQGWLYYDVMCGEQKCCTLRLKVPGVHNVLNSLGAYLMAKRAGIADDVIAKALEKFIGAKRRFETKGHAAGIWVVDDYAHHPTEIKATLKAAKELRDYRVVCVFQPHRYTRTHLLLDEFATAFREADVVVLTDIYTAGEEPINGIDGCSIPKAIEAKTGQKVVYVPELATLPQVVKELAQPKDLIITMGAGSINQYGPKILALLEER